MIAGLRAWWRGLRHLNHRGYLYIWGSFWWAVLTLPLITAPAAWAAIMRLSYTAYRSPASSLDDFWEGFRQNLRRSLPLAAANAAIIVVNTVNFAAYQHETGLWADFLRGVWLFVLLLWFTVQFYMWPLFYEMSAPSLLGAMRNAALMIALNPLFTLTLWLGIALVLAFSTVFFLAWLLITAGALAAIANAAVIDRLAAAGYSGVPQPEQYSTAEE